MNAFHTAATLEAHLTLAQVDGLFCQLEPEQQAKIITELLANDEHNLVVDKVATWLKEHDLI